ncbi:MAG: hypothetical protein A2008_06145 [Candidatus Wallbacteria bacterium GWC2_49_35]|uniref:Putative manganese efflux pump MntP n=1 Tax=Candidatus Wallbacteria bacterium GWC2_49_35 TaxID=1817813 RepID=A0A1F7WFR4_9BACT|nr:MAG: hypothetical protein A2008_06145 [Candidatus Wallbacteria bacterium GWC2_49_35]HBC73576.1 manganese efflux pump [Candidatus Wallbacteria bacterium]
MNFITILFMAVGLAMDAFAVSIATSLSLVNVSKRQIFRLSFHTGLFQFMMPVIGWYLGFSFSAYISDYDHWIAFTLLSIIGGKMIHESFKEDEPPAGGEQAAAAVKKDPTRGFSLMFIAVATSIDALAVGVSLAMLNVNIWYPSAVIGVVTMSLSVLGMKIGERLGSHFGSRMEQIGGLILIAIGLKILIEHMYFS